MRLLDYFRSTRNTNSASTAKDRLQVIIAHERQAIRGPDYLPALRRDILEVIKRYIPVTEKQLDLHVEQEGEYEVLELNVTLPDEEKIAS